MRKRTLVTGALLALLAAEIAPTAHAAPANQPLALPRSNKPTGTRFTDIAPAPVRGCTKKSGWTGTWPTMLAHDPRYFLFGRLFDTQAMKDLTGPKSPSEPSDPEHGRRQTDRASINCRFMTPSRRSVVTVPASWPWSATRPAGCKQLEAELAAIDNVTVYTFLVPFLGGASNRHLVRGLAGWLPGATG